MANKSISEHIASLKNIRLTAPSYHEYQYNLGRMYELEKKDYDLAIQHYTNVVTQNNSEYYAMAQFGLGYIYAFNKNNSNLAITHFRNIKKENYSFYANAQYYLGDIFFARNDFEKANQYYSNVSYDSSRSHQYINASIFSRLFKNGGEKDDIKKLFSL